MKFRYEHDTLGSIKVPKDKYWGASTERSKKYFDIGKILVRKTLIVWLLLIVCGWNYTSSYTAIYLLIFL